MNELVVAWRDYGIEYSIVLGSPEYKHDLSRNIIYLPRDRVLEDRIFKVKVYGDGRIVFKRKTYELSEKEVAVIGSELEMYSEEDFLLKMFGGRKLYK